MRKIFFATATAAALAFAFTAATPGEALAGGNGKVKVCHFTNGGHPEKDFKVSDCGKYAYKQCKRYEYKGYAHIIEISKAGAKNGHHVYRCERKKRD
jgi:hypothetical protein